MNANYPTPTRLNAVILAAFLSLHVTLFVLASFVVNPLGVLAIAITFGFLMNFSYALAHEAQHGILFPNKWLNDAAGVVLFLFFPAPFHLTRQGHLHHHAANRTHNETIDLCYPNEPLWWKRIQFYGILTGFFWITVVLGGFVIGLLPNVTRLRRFFGFDNLTDGLLERLNPRHLPAIRVELALIVMLHSAILFALDVPLTSYVAMYAAFGISWSTLQYVHHYGTPLDPIEGARNLATCRLIDRLWLNHNYHLTHHRNPVLPWVYLEEVATLEGTPRESMLRAYLRMWRGPKRIEDL